MKPLRPFFSFYGAKWRASKLYPSPSYGTVIEPFAGSACYSLHYHENAIRLYDKDPVICGVWDFLIKAKDCDITSLPDIVKHVDEIKAPQEVKNLVGFWLNKGMTSPCNIPSAWLRSSKYETKCQWWGPGIKERIIKQVPFIRHWKIFQEDYNSIPNCEASWFIDPPYNNANGSRYKYSSLSIDFNSLSEFCRNRKGQVIVCEQEGASWLPFKELGTVKAASKKYSREVVWIKDKV